jgi:hypothetical protein
VPNTFPMLFNIVFLNYNLNGILAAIAFRAKILV